jgi:hypothetical protein
MDAASKVEVQPVVMIRKTIEAAAVRLSVARDANFAA